MRQRISTVADLGLILRATRKQANLRLDAVAASAGVGHVFVRDVEHGKESVQLGRVLHLLRELGIELHAEFPDEVGPTLQEVNAKGLRPLTPRSPTRPLKT